MLMMLEKNQLFRSHTTEFYIRIVGLGRSRARYFADQAITAVTTSVTTSKYGDNIQASILGFVGTMRKCLTTIAQKVIFYSKGRDTPPSEIRTDILFALGHASRYGFISMCSGCYSLMSAVTPQCFHRIMS